jgi:hypothetical protein
MPDLVCPANSTSRYTPDMTRVKTLLIVLCACAVLAPPAKAQRLPTAVVPQHYDLMFAIELQTAGASADRRRY